MYFIKYISEGDTPEIQHNQSLHTRIISRRGRRRSNFYRSHRYKKFFRRIFYGKIIELRLLLFSIKRHFYKETKF